MIDRQAAQLETFLQLNETLNVAAKQHDDELAALRSKLKLEAVEHDSLAAAG